MAFECPQIPMHLPQRDDVANLATYAAALDTYQAKLMAAGRELADATMRLGEDYMPGLKDALDEAGVEYDVIPTETIVHALGGDLLGERAVSGIAIRNLDTRARRAIEDAKTDARRGLERELEDVQDAFKTLSRATEDCAEAVTDLTEIRPLGEPNYDEGAAIHVYAISAGEVFESHVGAGTRVAFCTEPIPNPNLDVDELRQGVGMDDAIAEAEEQGENIYVVENPCKCMPTDALVEMVILEHVGQRETIAREKRLAEIEEKFGPKNTLLQSMRQGRDLLAPWNRAQ